MSYEVVVNALADLIVSIDLSDDDLVDADFAATVLGDATAAFDGLAADERTRITDIITEHADGERNVERRDALRELPEQLGLTD